MRLNAFFLLVCFSHSWAISGYSQETKLTLKMSDSKIIEVLDKIEEQSEFYFLFNQRLVDVEREVDINAEEKTIDNILQRLFAGTNVNYMIYNRQIILTTFNKELMPEQTRTVSGKVTDSNNQPLPGVSIVIKGTTQGTVTNNDGEYSLTNIPPGATLIFSFVGMRTQEVFIGDQTKINVILIEEVIGIEEVVAVGYGTQKRSDITGNVVSVSQERLENAPAINVAQALQGAVSGVTMMTSSASAKPDEIILIRGRNSITADNDPLIIIDGVPGGLYDVEPSDVKSIEVLKDASAAAIYGSRAANGVILITTKEGTLGKIKINYNGSYSLENFVNIADYMTGEELYQYKMLRNPSEMTDSEHKVYQEKAWTDWTQLVIQQGKSQNHNISLSGANDKTNYYLSLNYLDKKGIVINDNYKRGVTRINLNTAITDWLKFSTRTHLLYEDESGAAPGNIYQSSGEGIMNPLTRAYEDDGSIRIYPWPEDTWFPNMLSPILYDDVDHSYQAVTNNAVDVSIPFVKGLSYKLNTGFRVNWREFNQYRGRDTKNGEENLGYATTRTAKSLNTTIENIFSYIKEFGRHNVFLTGLYSYEENTSNQNEVAMRQFPNDFLVWYGASQAQVILPEYSYNNSVIISQMLRLNYGFDSRYLFTLTGRRDGYSGFGVNSKWGIFPSFATAWNLHNESFFPLANVFNELKIRGSYGTNGNQAVNPYSALSRLGLLNYVDGANTRPGYYPTVLAQKNLGWESSIILNLGVDFGILDNRINGDVNLYHTTTSDLLLDRTISAVHGISSTVQNIGKIENNGVELSLISRNILTNLFTWRTEGNMSWNKNKILSLYGFFDEEGKEMSDVANEWFIGEPIRVMYDYVFDGVWQLDEAEEAAKWGTEPGGAKLKDLNGDGKITADVDRAILGQVDPKMTWGLTNVFRYKSFEMSVFLYGIHGMTKRNPLIWEFQEGANRRNVLDLNFWTPDNPTNDYWAVKQSAMYFAGIDVRKSRQIEDASFVRLKDITISYDVPQVWNQKLGIDKLRVYITARNLATFTKWIATDPEISDQTENPMSRSFEFGLNLGF